MDLLIVVKAMGEEYLKIAHDLTTSQRSDLPKKDFAEPGKRGYPVEDRQHAISALGFAKMHHDTGAYAAVRAKVEKKFPGLIEKKGGECYIGRVKGKEKDSNMGATPESLSAAKLPATFQAPQVQGAAQMGKMGGALQRIGQHLHDKEGLHEVLGLGTLAVPGLDTIQAHTRAALSGEKGPKAVEKRRMLSEPVHSALDVGGLGYLAAPTLAKKLTGHGWG